MFTVVYAMKRNKSMVYFHIFYPKNKTVYKYCLNYHQLIKLRKLKSGNHGDFSDFRGKSIK